MAPALALVLVVVSFFVLPVHGGSQTPRGGELEHAVVTISDGTSQSYWPPLKG